MHFPARIIRLSLFLVSVFVPLIFLPSTSELFEFNKMVLTYFLTAIICGAWIADMLLKRKIIFAKTPLDIPILLFLFVNLASLILSIDPRTSWLGYYSRFNGGLVSLVCYSLLYWSFVTYMDRKSTYTWIFWSILTSSLIAFYGVLEHWGIDAHLWQPDVQNRVFSTLGQPNWLAAYLCALVFVPLSLITNSSLKKNSQLVWLSWVAFTLISACLVFTKSRSGFMGYGLSLSVFWLVQLFMNKKDFRTLVRPLGITAAIVLGLFVIFPNPVRDLVVKSGINTETKQDGTAMEIGGTESGSIRKIVWKGALAIWNSSSKTFLLGTGPETFAQAYYQYRPVEHNSTSEWELLYNKAHNEFVNYLATTGILGLGSYLLLLGSMLHLLITRFHRHTEHKLLALSFLCGWLTIPTTNFFGFSVVIVQILTFLLPAASIALDTQPVPASKHSPKPATGQIMLVSVLFIFVFYILLQITKYWLADIKYSSGQKNMQAFALTSDPAYILNAYQELNSAYDLNPSDPPIISELAAVTAYVSVFTHESDSTSSAGLANLAMNLADKSISISPHHPNYYKSKARTAILLSTYDPAYLEKAAQAIEQAIKISPTDPRLPHNLGVIYRYMGQKNQAEVYLKKAIELKADFHDPKVQLQEMASESAQTD